MKTFLLAALFGLYSTALGASDPAPNKSSPEQTITAVGSGVVTVRPDTAQIRLVLVTQAASAAAARTDSNTVTGQLIRRVGELGIPKGDVETSRLGLVPQYNQGIPGVQEPEVVGYRLTNEVRVKVRDLDRLDKVLDDLTAQGPSLVQDVRFFVDNPKRAWNDASRKAMAEARRKAEALAREAGLDVGEVVKVEELGPEKDSSYATDRKRPAQDSYSASSTDEQECRTSVAVTYAVRPHQGGRTLEGKSRP